LSDSRKKGLIDLAKELDVKNDLVKLTESYTSLVSTLRTDEEKLTDEMRERFAVMDAMKGLSADDRKKTGGRIAEAAFQDAPEYEGLAPEVGGAFGELMKLEDSASELDDWYNTQIERLDKFRQERSDLNAVWDEQETKLKQDHEDGLASIEQSRQLLALKSTGELFASLTDITGKFAGEQSGLYRAMFAVEKAASIATSLIAIKTAMALASKSGPFPENLAAMATVAAATASIVGDIMAVGMAHDGVDSVPKSGTWLLEKGERVTTANTSAKLDKTLEETKKSQGKSATNLRIVNAFDTAVIGDYLGSSSGEQLIMNTVKRNQRTIQSMSR